MTDELIGLSESGVAGGADEKAVLERGILGKRKVLFERDLKF